MDIFIEDKKGYGWTSSQLIADIGKEVKDENFEHLIIVTDGGVDSEEIKKCDDKVKEYNLQFRYVSIYIIGSDGDESVGCPFCRGIPGVTYKTEDNGEEKKLATCNKDDTEALQNIDKIKSLEQFNSKYLNLFNAIRSKCLGKKEDNDLKNALNDFKKNITIPGEEQKDFDLKFNKLNDMASGILYDISNAENITAAN